MTLFPRPTKATRPGILRRKEIKKKDIAFQKDLPPNAKCLVPNCPNEPGKHHRIKRRRNEYRHDDRYAMLLCWNPHHMEIERTGEEAFCEKYKINVIPLPQKL